MEFLYTNLLIYQRSLKDFIWIRHTPLSTPMVVRSLETIKDPFRPKGNDEVLLGPEVPYRSAIGALMYLLVTLDLIYHLL